MCLDDTPCTDIYTLSLHDALPISHALAEAIRRILENRDIAQTLVNAGEQHVKERYDPQITVDQYSQLLRGEQDFLRSEEHTSELQSLRHLVCRLLLEKKKRSDRLRKNNRLKKEDIRHFVLHSSGLPVTDEADKEMKLEEYGR